MLDRYEILEPIGRGGMEEVFLARDPALDRQLAIKVLPPEFVADKNRCARLLREARAVSKCAFPFLNRFAEIGAGSP